ncbi:MAG: hypothetical protein ABSC08_20490 [Bryobacteraceae bacterium]
MLLLLACVSAWAIDGAGDPKRFKLLSALTTGRSVELAPPVSLRTQSTHSELLVATVRLSA